MFTCRLATTIVLLAGLFLLAFSAGAAAQEKKPAAEEPGEKRAGRTIRLNLPITAKTEGQVRRFVQRVLDEAAKKQFRPVLIFEFHVPEGQEDLGRGSQRGIASDLARFLSSDELTGARTVAYIPQPIQGHAVLVALACDEIIMGPNASIGSAGIDEKRIDDGIVGEYRQIALRRLTVPVELALGMLDPSREVLEIETEVGGTEFVTPEELEKVRKQRTIKQEKVLIPRGEAAQFSAADARRLGFVSFLVDDRTELARELGLAPEAVEEDLGLAEEWRAVRVDLRQPINAKIVNDVTGLINDAIEKQDANFICLWLESPGGSPADSMQLAMHLVDVARHNKVRTVAYIPVQALSDAALVALACDQIVMAPDAKLGGWGASTFTETETKDLSETIRERLAPGKSRSWSLPVAIIDKDLVVYRCTRLGVDEYFCQAELDAQPAADEWEKHEPPVTRANEPFEADGRRAVKYRLADHTVENFSQFKEIYGLENDPRLTEPNWADMLIAALSSKGAAFLLFIIGGAALYAELQMPGVGVGGFIAAICFLLLFWGQFLGGTAGVLEILLFLTGVVCLLLEIFVFPGFGIFGLGGGALILGSVVLASQTFIRPQNPYQAAQFQSSLMMLGGAIVGIIAVAVVMNRWLPRAPVLGRVMLNPLSDEEKERLQQSESLVDYSDLLGRQGVTTTQLTPGGKARFGDRLVDVMADSELIEPNTPIVVVEVHGSRVVVESVDTS